jgi:glucose-6-phosphate isomerase
MKPGTIGYIPPYWGHRAINTGNKKLILFAIYPAEARHNYKIVEQRGFAKIMVEERGTSVLRENPKYRGDKDAE